VCIIALLFGSNLDKKSTRRKHNQQTPMPTPFLLLHFRSGTVGQRSLHSWGRLRKTIQSALLRWDSTGVDGLEARAPRPLRGARSRRQQITLYGGAGARCLNCPRVYVCVSTICSATARGAPLSMFALAIGTLANTAQTHYTLHGQN
jgi:hypothetical protein